MQAVKVYEKFKEHSESKDTLLKYEFVGGIYAVLLTYFVVLLCSSVVTIILIGRRVYDYFLKLVSIASTYNIKLAKAVEYAEMDTITLLSIIFTVVSVFALIWSIVSIAILEFKYLKNRNTFFIINNESIFGVGVAKDSLGKSFKKEFDIKINELNNINVENGFLVFSANNLKYKIMITSRDFNKILKNVIKSIR